jgi:hypothetical protein
LGSFSQALTQLAMIDIFGRLIEAEEVERTA